MLLASVGVAYASTDAAYAHESGARTAAVHHPRTVDNASSTRAAAQDSARKAHKKKHRKKHAKKQQATHPLLWKQRTLYYYESIPAQWDWSLQTAVAKWNASGAKIRFVKVQNRRLARLTISYGSIGSRAGEATVGPMLHPWVRLSNSYRYADGNDASNRVEVMEVFAHELGHVLGFQHTTTHCALMSPVLDVAGCGMVERANPGYYKCRTIGQPLATALVRKYGGRARPAVNGWCLIDPMPPVLQGVTFSGGDSSDTPSTVTWTVPGATPAGSTVEIKAWNSDTCGAAPVGSPYVQVPVSSAAWQATGELGAARCFSAELVNRYGVGRQAVAGKVIAGS